jgi:hypothetical protein
MIVGLISWFTVMSLLNSLQGQGLATAHISGLRAQVLILSFALPSCVPLALIW